MFFKNMKVVVFCILCYLIDQKLGVFSVIEEFFNSLLFRGIELVL